jgi:hypothetical protein
MKIPINELRKVDQFIRKARQRIIHSDTSSLENDLIDECLHLCADYQEGLQLIKSVLDEIGDEGNRMEEVEHEIEHELLPKSWEKRKN